MGETALGLLTFPIERSGVHPLANLIGILSSLTHEPIALVTGNAGRVFEDDARVRFSAVDHVAGGNVVSRVLHNVITQARLTRRIRELDGVDTWIFFFSGEVLVLPMVAAKLFRRQVILALPAHTPTMMAPEGDSLLVPSKILTGMTCRLCDRIVLYSPALINHWGLERYRDKIVIAREHLLDFEKFRVEVPLEERPAAVGYIGRLSGEKGVQNFVQALPALLSNRQDLRVLIGGDGELKEAIKTALHEAGLTVHVDLPGWISHNDLPNYLNQLRLLILPSYTEGLPNIMLEAMACGTPVLATPVGAVPDFIKDGETGFILASNSPEDIATSVQGVLRRPDLASVTKAAREHVEQEITYEQAVARFAAVIEGLRG